jgi:hypothetical protein
MGDDVENVHALAFADQTNDKRDDRHEGEYEEQNFGYFDCAGGNTTEAEDRCDQRNDEKGDGVIQHGLLLEQVTGEFNR